MAKDNKPLSEEKEKEKEQLLEMQRYFKLHSSNFHHAMIDKIIKLLISKI